MRNKTVVFGIFSVLVFCAGSVWSQQLEISDEILKQISESPPVSEDTVNYARETEKYKKLARKNDVSAMYRVGHLYELYAKDEKAAVKWFTKAALLGHRNSSERLYKLYEAKAGKIDRDYFFEKGKNLIIDIKLVDDSGKVTERYGDGEKKIKEYEKILKKGDKVRKEVRENYFKALIWAYVTKRESKKTAGMFIVPDIKYVKEDIKQFTKKVSDWQKYKAGKEAEKIISKIIRNSKKDKYIREPKELFWP